MLRKEDLVLRKVSASLNANLAWDGIKITAVYHGSKFLR